MQHQYLAPDRESPARLGFPSCPACGALALSPAHSQFVSERIVQHCWACEDCGYLFVSRVRVLERSAEIGDGGSLPPRG